MSEDAFAPLDLELGRMLAAIDPAARLRFARSIGRQLRASQAARIAGQRNPDGSAFAPRKKEPLRDRRGGIKRRTKAATMFRKLRLARWLRVDAGADEIMVGFTAAAARIARVHQLGLRDRVSRRADAPEVTYAARELLGFTEDERLMILAAAAELIAG